MLVCWLCPDSGGIRSYLSERRGEEMEDQEDYEQVQMDLQFSKGFVNLPYSSNFYPITGLFPPLLPSLPLGPPFDLIYIQYFEQYQDIS